MLKLILGAVWLSSFFFIAGCFVGYHKSNPIELVPEVPRRKEIQMKKFISDKTVLNIRKEFRRGVLTQYQIAKRFRVAQASVSRIGNRLQRATV